MRTTKLGVVGLAIQFCLVHVAFGQPPFSSKVCLDTNGNYTNKSTYKTNLNTALSSIPSAIQNDDQYHGFYNVSIGQEPDTAYAVVLCRGDLTVQDCHKCVNNSVIELPKLCPTQKEAVGWYDECMLRYSSQSMLGTSDEQPMPIFSNVQNVTTDPGVFNKALGELLNNIQAKAASGNSELKFATGDTNVSDFNRFFALAQCTPDLPSLTCFNCLGDLINKLPGCCANKMGVRIFAPSCNIRYESYLFYAFANSSSSSPLPAALASPPQSSNSSSPSTNGKGSNTVKIVAIISASAIVSIIVASGLCFVFRRKKSKNVNVASVPEQHDEDDESASTVSQQYDFDTLRVATNDFADFNKLGQGGFGAVYKGRLANGQEIAVKRLSQNSGQGDNEFKNEVLLVAKLQHRNLVRLMGYCLDKQEKLLVYEYVPNTSLDHFLFDPHRSQQLVWEKRYKIITGTARGILYLHEDSRLRIIHRDLKASNVLLDADMNAKIADFGMAKLFGADQTRGDTSRIAGTYGYMAPEYALHGFFSVKSDVYSFGVLVLEIITGKKCIGVRNGEYSEDLISFVWRNWSEGTHLNIVDPRLTTGSKTEMMRCIHIGLLCVQENDEDRPTMSSVVLMLSSYSLTLPVPSGPSFNSHSGVGIGNINHSKSTSRRRLSVNEDSITKIDPR